MTQTAEQYGRVLYEMHVSTVDVKSLEETFLKAPELVKVLDNPVLAKSKKHTIIEKIFPISLHNFMKTVSDNRRTAMIYDIVESWKNSMRRAAGIISATLYCVHEPDETQKGQIEKFVRDTYGAKGVEMTVEHRPDLIGGFVLRIGDREYDWSLKGRLQQLQQRLVRR
ncbi:MAG: ATP synthase F1 subunit delta [Clostridia bacterium]|nr:ATP synthase F1 subunit delta [Clostridia bacterium]NCC42794.1 ATP synthase F1 subunit delta [Clostridia bacterium]